MVHSSHLIRCVVQKFPSTTLLGSLYAHYPTIRKNIKPTAPVMELILTHIPDIGHKTQDCVLLLKPSNNKKGLDNMFKFSYHYFKINYSILHFVPHQTFAI